MFGFPESFSNNPPLVNYLPVSYGKHYKVGEKTNVIVHIVMNIDGAFEKPEVLFRPLDQLNWNVFAFEWIW